MDNIVRLCLTSITATCGINTGVEMRPAPIIGTAVVDPVRSACHDTASTAPDAMYTIK